MLSSLYPYMRPLIFCVDPEVAHNLTIRMLSFTQDNFLSKLYKKERVHDQITLAGITFPNRIGLAAGLDKDGTCLDGFGHLGFGSIEVGTVTPRAQPGNPKPRMFRLPDANALINSCGFNNEGTTQLVKNVESAQFRNQGGILGINIGKNKETLNERATEDYLKALNEVYAHADYVAINISSPNTQNLRDLQGEDSLDELLASIMQERNELAQKQGRIVPIFLKVAPDLESKQLEMIAATLLKHQVDGVIATNTTIDHQLVNHLSHGKRAGGLSGAPLRNVSNQVIRELRKALGPNYPIIGVGGVMSAYDALEKIQAGANLVQIYTGLIYQGPNLVNKVAETLAQNSSKQ